MIVELSKVFLTFIGILMGIGVFRILLAIVIGKLPFIIKLIIFIPLILIFICIANVII